MLDGIHKNASYEELRERIAECPVGASGAARDVQWVSDAEVLGFARGPDGGLELFFVGDSFSSTRPAVAQRLVHGSWQTVDGAALGATRMLLPNEPHYDRVAAFICAELILSGADDDVQRAFMRVESVVEMALSDGATDSAVLTGLCGELLFLDALVRARPASAKEILMGSWAGYTRSSRDLQLASVGVEVKTTTRAQSEHHVQGPYQVELSASVNGVQETALFLASVGIVWLPRGVSESFVIPGLVESLVSRLTTVDRKEFLRRLRGYAGPVGGGYDHDADTNASEYFRGFATTFVRLYDMTDDRIRLPASEWLSGMNLLPASVSYDILLPNQVNGSLNPVEGLASAALAVLTAGG